MTGNLRALRLDDVAQIDDRICNEFAFLQLQRYFCVVEEHRHVLYAVNVFF